MRIIAALLAGLALLLVGCADHERPSGQSSGAGSIAPSSPVGQPSAASVPKEDDRPVSAEELTAIGYTDKQLVGGHEQWRTGPRVNFPVLVIQDGKIISANAEDGTFTCLISLESKLRRLTPATAVGMYQAALKYKAGPPSISTTSYQRGGTKGSVTCSYTP